MKGSGSVGRALDWGRWVAISNLTAGGVTVFGPWARHSIRCLVLIQPRKTRPDMTENCCFGRKKYRLLYVGDIWNIFMKKS